MSMYSRPYWHKDAIPSFTTNNQIKGILEMTNKEIIINSINELFDETVASEKERWDYESGFIVGSSFYDSHETHMRDLNRLENKRQEVLAIINETF